MKTTVKKKAPWEIPARSRSCSQGHEPFEGGMEVHSHLYVTDGGHYQRQDFCSRCWTPQQPAPGGSIWKSLLPAKAMTTGFLAERMKGLVQLLENLLGAGSDAQDRQASILAQYLVRRRVLARRELVVRDGVSYNLFEETEGERSFLVPVVSIGAAEVDDIEKMLCQELTR